MLDRIITWLIKRLILLWDRHNDKIAFSFGRDEHTDYSVLVERFYDTYYTVGTAMYPYSNCGADMRGGGKLMYDELVKELRDSAEWADRLALLMGRAEGDTHAPIMRKAADAIEELQKITAHYEEESKGWWLAACDAKEERERLKEQIPKWIPVTERLPEKDQTVLAYCAEDNFCYISRMHQSFEDYNVTHWISLPQMPESEDN